MRFTLLVLCVFLSACTAWKPVTTEALADQDELGAAVVFPSDGDPVGLYNATVVADSVVGWADGERRAYAVADLDGVSQRRADDGRLEVVAKPVSSLAEAVIVGLVQFAVLISEIDFGDLLRL